MPEQSLFYTKMLACLEAVAASDAERGGAALAELEAVLPGGQPETAALLQALAGLIHTGAEQNAAAGCLPVMKSLLDGTGQGLLTFDANLRISPEYSSECSRIFGREIAGLHYVSLMFPGSTDQDLFADIFRDVLRTVSPAKQQVLLSILPARMLRGERTYAVEYKVLQEPYSRLMVLIADVTDKVILQAQIEEERALQQMIFRVVELYDSFTDTVRQFKALLQTATQMEYYISMAEEERKAICRDVHTLKGSFGHFGFMLLVDALNELEGFFSYGYETCGDTEKAMIIKQEMDELRTVFELYWRKLVTVLGERFFLHGNRVQVEVSELIAMENSLLALMPPDAAAIDRLRRWRYRSLTDMLLEYKLLVVDLGTRFDKHIQPLLVTGRDVLVDPAVYQEFGRSLIHIFRNMVDHGIERQEERVARGKPEIGRITCHIQTGSDGLQLAISDDGAGVDFTKVGAMALEKGLITPAALQAMDVTQVIELIFMAGLSTQRFVTLVSGRGVGLDAVRSAVETIGGKVMVHSVFGQGTTFTFILGKNYLPAD